MRVGAIRRLSAISSLFAGRTPIARSTLNANQSRLVDIDGRIYQMTSSTVPVAGEDEDACADDGADAEEDEGARAEGAPQAAVLGVGEEGGDGFAGGEGHAWLRRVWVRFCM
jgi:hypothetical protein